MIAKNDYVAGDSVDAADLNHIAEVANDGGGFDDSLNAGETINGATLPVPIYQNTSDNELYACDANDTAKLNFIGFAISNSTNGNPIEFQGSGIVGGFSGLDEGEMYYVQDAVGTIGTTPGTYPVPVGRAISTTQIFIIKLPKYAAGVITDLNAAANTVIGNNDATVTLGWKPRMIKLHFFLQGRNSSTGTADYRTTKGIATYIGTVLKFVNTLWNNDADNTSDESPTDDNTGQTSFVNTPNSTSAPTVGQNTNNSDFTITLSVASLSATGFTIRRAVASTAASASTAVAKVAYEAFE